MKKLFKYLLFSISFLSLFACKEDTLDLYDENTSGNNIYFLENYSKTRYDKFNQVISLGLASASLTDTIIKIPVRITGPKSEQDRPINVVIPDTCTMKEGIHFDFQTAPVIRANRTVDTISLILHRTEDLLSSQVYLKLTLQPNADFITNIATKKNSGYTIDLLSYELSYDDMFPVPYIWTTFAGKSVVLAYFGTYSRRKVELMLEVLQANPAVFYDSKLGISVAQIINWSTYMKYWLNKEKIEGKVYLDEAGNEITMGHSAM